MSTLVGNTERSPIVREYVEDIWNRYNALINLPHLHPCSAVNSAFNDLMETCIKIPEESIVHAIITDPQITPIVPHLHQICSQGECGLEKHWAQQIVSTSQYQDGMDLLTSFPYYSNYVDLTRMELNALRSASPDTAITRFAFLGCGHLPLTSLCILLHLSSSSFSTPPFSAPLSVTPPCFILNIDHASDAITCASSLCQRLIVPKASMAFRCDRAGSAHTDLRSFHAVYVAALVGATSAEKRVIFRDVLLRMQPGALLVVRTSHALRTLLYPEVKAATDLDPDLFEPLIVVHPYNHVVNSVIVGRVRMPRDLEDEG